jgi:hypothetical protein
MEFAVRVRFITHGNQGDISPSEKEENDANSSQCLENTLDFEILYSSIRDMILEPDRVVRFPSYYLRWLPYVSSQVIFVVMALWQEHYLASNNKAHKGNLKVAVRAEKICQWAGISRAQFFRLLQPGGQLEWFIRKIDTDYEIDNRTGRTKKSANKYWLYDLPLTPGDSADLKSYLLAEGIRTSALEVLQNAVNVDPKQILNYPVRTPPNELENLKAHYLTVQDIVYDLVGHRLTPEMIRLCDQLADRLLARSDFMLVSWYFLKQWLPLIGQDAAMFILVLRSQSYFNQETGVVRDEVWINDGYLGLANRLGIKNPRMIANWFPTQIEYGKRKEQWSEKTEKELARRKKVQELVGHFVTRIDHRPNASKSFAWKFKIQRVDPLTPQDQVIHQAVNSLLAKAEEQGILEELNTWIGELNNDCFETVEKGSKVGLRLSKLANGCSETLKDILKDCIETLELGCNDCFETLLKILKSIKDTLKEKNTTTNQDTTELHHVALGMTEVEDGWSLEKLLQKAEKKNRKLLLGQETNARAFVSWVIYGTSQLAIQNPFNLAIAKLKASPGIGAGGAYDRLAAITPKLFTGWIAAQLDYQSPVNTDWQRLFGQIKHERLRLMVEALCIDDFFEELAD